MTREEFDSLLVGDEIRQVGGGEPRLTMTVECRLKKGWFQGRAGRFLVTASSPTGWERVDDS